MHHCSTTNQPQVCGGNPGDLLKVAVKLRNASSFEEEEIDAGALVDAYHSDVGRAEERGSRLIVLHCKF